MPELTSSMRAQGRAVRELFSALAPRYDLQNRLFSLGLDMGWRRKLVGGVHSGPTGRILDLAAGTLDVSLLLSQRFPSASILAFDLCGPMLRRGMTMKIPSQNAAGIFPAVGDARALPLLDGSVDAVTVAFGIRNMVPREAALAEIHRVLMPGGQLHVLEFAPVEAPLLGPLYHWHLERVMPRLVGWMSGRAEAYHYLGESIARFPSPSDFARELDSAELSPLAWEQLTFGIANIHRAEKRKA